MVGCSQTRVGTHGPSPISLLSGQCAFEDPHGRTCPLLAVRVPAAIPGQKFRPFATGTRRGWQLMKALIGPRLWLLAEFWASCVWPGASLSTSNPRFGRTRGGLVATAVKTKQPVPVLFLLRIAHRSHNPTAQPTTRCPLPTHHPHPRPPQAMTMPDMDVRERARTRSGCSSACISSHLGPRRWPGSSSTT